MRKIVTTRSTGTANPAKLALVQAQGITDIIEPATACHLRKEQRDHVTPGAKCSRSFVHSRFPGQPGNQKRGNQIAKLMQNSDFGTGVVMILFFHPCSVAGLQTIRNTLLLSLYGTLLIFDLRFGGTGEEGRDTNVSDASQARQ